MESIIFIYFWYYFLYFLFLPWFQEENHRQYKEIYRQRCIDEILCLFASPAFDQATIQVE